VYRNALCAEMHTDVGRAPGYGIGQNYWEVYPRVVGTAVGSAIRRAMEKGENRVAEYLRLRTNRCLLLRAFPTGEGGVALFFRDITATRQIDEREAFLLRLSDRMRSLSDPRAIMRGAAE